MSPSCEATNQWFSPSRKLQKKYKLNWRNCCWKILSHSYLECSFVVCVSGCRVKHWGLFQLHGLQRWRWPSGKNAASQPGGHRIKSTVDLRYNTCVRVCLCAYRNQQNKNKTNMKYKNKTNKKKPCEFRSISIFRHLEAGSNKQVRRASSLAPPSIFWIKFKWVRKPFFFFLPKTGHEMCLWFISLLYHCCMFM